MAADRAWLVLTEPISTRVLVDCGVVAGLNERLRGRLTLVDVTYGGMLEQWDEQLEGVARIAREELMPVRVRGLERWMRAADRWLDRRIGYYPTAIRLNLREGFHIERMAAGHQNWFLDSARVGPLPRTPWIDATLEYKSLLSSTLRSGFFKSSTSAASSVSSFFLSSSGSGGSHFFSAFSQALLYLLTMSRSCDCTFQL